MDSNPGCRLKSADESTELYLVAPPKTRIKYFTWWSSFWEKATYVSSLNSTVKGNLQPSRVFNKIKIHCKFEN